MSWLLSGPVMRMRITKINNYINQASHYNLHKIFFIATEYSSKSIDLTMANEEKSAKSPLSTKTLALVGVGIAVVLVIVIAVGIGVGVGVGVSNANSASAEDSATYSNAAVAADAEACSKAGVEMLKKGGSAVDAAIAGQLCVGVVNFHSAGIGGGGFMVYYNHTSGESFALDFREVAPLNASTYMYNNTASDSHIRGIYICTIQRGIFVGAIFHKLSISYSYMQLRIVMLKLLR